MTMAMCVENAGQDLTVNKCFKDQATCVGNNANITSPRSLDRSEQTSGTADVEGIDYTWDGSSIGLVLQRGHAKPNKRYEIEVIWKAGNLGITFGVDEASDYIVILRISHDTAEKYNVKPGFILRRIGQKFVDGRSFDETMAKLKIIHEVEGEATLYFSPPPKRPVVRECGPKLRAVHIHKGMEIVSANGMCLRYLELPEISRALLDMEKPCLLHFQEISDDSSDSSSGEEEEDESRRKNTQLSAAIAAIAVLLIA